MKTKYLFNKMRNGEQTHQRLPGRAEVTEEAHDRLIESVYTAVQDPDAWNEVFTTLHESIGLDAWNLTRFDRGGDEVIQMLAVGGKRMTPAAGALYESYYGAIDPLAGLVRRLPAGQVISCHRFFDERYVARSEFYQDFLLPAGVRYVLGVSPFRQERRDFVLGLLREAGRGPFEEVHESLLARLLPHMSRSLRLMDQLHAQLGYCDMALAALDTTPLAVFALDATGCRVHHGNRRGDQMLRAGNVLLLQSGKLTCADASQQNLLDDAVLQCRRTGRPATVLLRHRDRVDQRYSVTVLQARSQSVLACMAEPGRLLCLVSPLGRRRVATAQQLIDLFGLTPAEARLARALVAGATLETYARENDVKLPTVKKQLREVFAKTGVDRQAALVRTIGSVPAVRDKQ